MVLAGGVDFFSALLAADSPGSPASPLPLPRPPGAAGREFFVSGSSTAVARTFAAAARRDQTPVFSLPQELAWGAVLRPEATAAIVGRIVSAFESHARVVLTVGLPPVRNEKVSRGLTGQLVQIAAAVLERVEVGQVYADGGATAAELVWRMGWSRLKLLRERAPGVATLAVADKNNLWLTIKPGSYPWPVEWTASG
jgi:D-threonate/D-erythronate kinase